MHLRIACLLTALAMFNAPAFAASTVVLLPRTTLAAAGAKIVAGCKALKLTVQDRSTVDGTVICEGPPRTPRSGWLERLFSDAGSDPLLRRVKFYLRPTGVDVRVELAQTIEYGLGNYAEPPSPEEQAEINDMLRSAGAVNTAAQPQN